MVDRYIRGNSLGEGTWGHVYEASRKSDLCRVAIKRIKPMEMQFGINFTALREIKCLQSLCNSNIVQLMDTFLSSGVLHLVLEYCPFDLEKIIRDKSIALNSTHIKCYMQMLLQGIKCCHDHFILHRDLKPANLLIDEKGVLKLADFGLARTHGSPQDLTSEVVTRWYRSPELLFGARLYGDSVDMWAVGCIFAELIFRIPLFPGNSDIEQLAKIFNVLGTPTSLNWPNATMLPNYVEFESRTPMNLSPLFRHSFAVVATSSTTTHQHNMPLDMELLLQLLTLNPSKRITATEALVHPYFTSGPGACLPSQLQLPVPASGKNWNVGDSGEPGTKRLKI